MSLSSEAVSAARASNERLRRVVDAALDRGREITGKGRDIDAHQVHSERLAYLATEALAAETLVAYAEQAGTADPFAAECATIFAAQAAARARAQLAEQTAAFGVAPALVEQTLASSEEARLHRAGGRRRAHRGARARGRGATGTPDSYLESEEARLTRETVRDFARSEVAPLAQHIHLNDDLVPESIIGKMGELGFFGLAVPEQYSGQGMGNLAMIVTTEELSAASLAAAGSLITRPEILTKALLAGGSEQQKQQWLPRIAAGEIMVAISVTEPDTGSDVASVKVRAEKGEQDGKPGYFISGAKAWCTFAGRANVIAMLTRTDPDLAKGAKGLSLFIVPKDPFTGHEFVMRQPGGGTIEGKADRTPGYRGMHSYTLQIDRYFVPAENLVGGEGKGFYLQMSGFAAGRLQTGGRASGLAQAALEARRSTPTSARSSASRSARTSSRSTSSAGWRSRSRRRASSPITPRASSTRTRGARSSPRWRSCSRATSRCAPRRKAQLLHGGWGFAEEFPICRYVVDALVLPIFEGVKPILELKVIARSLLG